ncbi:hypothetical protein OAP32_00250 [Crocinitomicaceae bacterium]|nr:hypothetical protein [Crocinitomicaceae bacterium]
MNKLSPYFLCILLISATSCSEEEMDPLDTRNFQLNTYMKGYHAKNFPSVESVKVGNPSVFVDLSSGVKYAFDENENKNSAIIEQIAGVLEEGHDWFEVVDKKITAISKGRYALFNTMTNNNSFGGVYAPIGPTLDKIKTMKNDVLFITDFEEYTPGKDGGYQNEEQMKPYLVEPFKEWMNGNNSITIIYSDRYTEQENNNAKKRLLFTVFNFGPDKVMLKSIQTALETSGISYESLNLDLSTFSAQIK